MRWRKKRCSNKASKLHAAESLVYPNAILCFFAGNMQLHVDSDAAFLVVNGAKSRIAGYFY
eukprot:5398361-Ditylum_brightwellii.AAC.1